MKTIHDIIDMMGSDPAGISSKFGIPIRTVYGWCNGSRTPPDYLICMMLNILLLERRLNYGNGLGEGMVRSAEEIKEAGKEGESETCTS